MNQTFKLYLRKQARKNSIIVIIPLAVVSLLNLLAFIMTIDLDAENILADKTTRSLLQSLIVLSVPTFVSFTLQRLSHKYLFLAELIGPAAQVSVAICYVLLNNFELIGELESVDR